MKYFKLILFVITAVVFILSSYILLFQKVHGSDMIGVLFNFFVVIIAFITGIITVKTLFKSSKIYLYTFWVVLSIMLFGKIIDSGVGDVFNSNKRQFESQKKEIWKNINNPEKVEELLSKSKEFAPSSYEYNGFKASVYFGLSKNDENYYSKYKLFIEDNRVHEISVVEEILNFNTPNTEEDYLWIFKALEKPHRGLDLCVTNSHYGRIEEKDFYFKTLYERGYKKAALEALKEKTEHPNYNIRQLKKIDDIEYRKTAFVTLIENTDFSNYKLKDFYKFILEQKQEKYFDSYLKLFSNNLSTFNFEKTEFVNQKEQPLFMELYQLLGNKHQFIKSFPNEYINRQIAYQKETKGKPFIHFVKFFSITVDLKHTNPRNIDGSSFYVTHKNKLIHKGTSNKYGCVSFKGYDLKPTDTIEVSSSYFRFKNQIGWQQLLPTWNTEEGAKARFYAMGYNPRYDNIYQKYGDGKTIFTTEIAKKVKTDFDSFFDVKWQE